MAGSFNGAILKAFITNYKPGERIIVIGDKGYKFLVRNRLEKYIIKHLNLSNRPTDFFQFKMIGEYIYRMYAKKAIGNVKIQFTHFKSSTSSAPVISQIVPVDVNAIKNSVSNNEKHVALGTFTVDPNAESASRKILTLYLEFSLYAAYIESTLCEHLSRKNAMIEASLNEDIKTTELRMQYNKKRQEKITQEVARLSLSL
jgi:F-type H+-transporting ATPase subunit gamma